MARKRIVLNRGDRIARRGDRLFFAGFAGNLIGGLVTGVAHVPGPVIFAVLMIAFAMALAGMGVSLTWHRRAARALVDYDRKVEAGEIAPWKPGDPNPLA